MKNIQSKRITVALFITIISISGFQLNASLSRKLNRRNPSSNKREQHRRPTRSLRKGIEFGTPFEDITKKCKLTISMIEKINTPGRPTHKDIIKYIETELLNKDGIDIMISFKKTRELLKILISNFITKTKTSKKFKKNLNRIGKLGEKLSNPTSEHINIILEKEFGDFILNEIQK